MQPRFVGYRYSLRDICYALEDIRVTGARKKAFLASPLPIVGIGLLRSVKGKGCARLRRP